MGLHNHSLLGAIAGWVHMSDSQQIDPHIQHISTFSHGNVAILYLQLIQEEHMSVSQW